MSRSDAHFRCANRRNRVLLLNLTTDVINFWQDEATKHTIEEAKEKYPQVLFQGN